MASLPFFERFFPSLGHDNSAANVLIGAEKRDGVLTEDAAVLQQAAIIRRIKMSYGFDDRTFESHVLTSIHGLARYLYLIPASSSAIYPGAGGAFRMSLEIGLYALHAADGRSFERQDTGRSRDELRHRWRLASLLAGMFGELHRVFDRVEVANEKGEYWPVGVTPLLDWLNQFTSKRFTVRFRQNPIEARALSVHVASQIIPPDVIKYLSVGDPLVITQLFTFLGTATTENNPLTDIVRRTASAVLDRNIRETPVPGGKANGQSLTTLYDGLRALIASSDWLPNGPESKTWYAKNGFFVAWPAAALDLVRCTPDVVPAGADPVQHIFRLLQESELISSSDDGDLWHISPPGSRVPIDAIRIAAPLLTAAGITGRVTPLSQDIAIFFPEVISQTAQRPPPSTRGGRRSDVRANTSLQLFPEGAVDDEKDSLPGPNAVLVEQTPVQLSVRYRTMINPYVRDGLEGIVTAVATDNEVVLARPHEHGLFIAAEAWEKAGVDSSVAVRSLFDAGMLHLNPAEPNKRVFSMMVGDTTYTGCIVRPEFIDDWGAWVAARSGN